MDFVQAKAAGSASSPQQTVALTLDTAPTEGNLLVAITHNRNSALTPATPTDWTKAPLDFNAEAVDMHAFWRIAGAAESATVTMDLGEGNSAHQTLWVGEYGGTWGPQADILVHDLSSTSGTGIAPTTGLVGITDWLPGPALVVGAIGLLGNTAIEGTWTEGFSHRGDATSTTASSSSSRLLVADLLTDGPGEFSSRTNWTNARRARAVLLVFEEDPAPRDRLQWAWVGATTRSSTVITVRTTEDGDVRIRYGTASDMSGATFTSVQTATLATNKRALKFELTGLETDTRYHYQVEVSGELQTGRQSSFRTFPFAISSFSFASSGDASYRTVDSDFPLTAVPPSTHTVFDHIRAQEPTLFWCLGDFHYDDRSSTNEDDHLVGFNGQLSARRQRNVYGRVPSAYIYGDHDFAGNDSYSLSPAAAAAIATYRRIVPHWPLISGTITDPVYTAFTVGRVRFFNLDGRAAKSEKNNTDNASKTMLGAAQKAWFKAELDAYQADGNLVAAVVASETAWLMPQIAGNDAWGGYTTERAELANYIVDNGIENVMFFHADSHMLAADDGTNNTYDDGGQLLAPVFCCSPLDREGSTKNAGPYSLGQFEGATYTGQYGLFEVTDSGDMLTIDFSGLRVDGVGNATTLLSHQVNFPASNSWELHSDDADAFADFTEQIANVPDGLILTFRDTSYDLSEPIVLTDRHDLTFQGPVTLGGATRQHWKLIGSTGITFEDVWPGFYHDH